MTGGHMQVAVVSGASLLPVDARRHLFRACGAGQHFLTKSPLLFVYHLPSWQECSTAKA